MYRLVLLLLVQTSRCIYERSAKDPTMIAVLDLTTPTTWSEMSEYFLAVEKHWKICINCGIPGLGTSMHLDNYGPGGGGTYPAVIPPEFLLTRLRIIDVSSLARHDQDFVLTLDVAQQWMAVKRDSNEPTLLLFKFGWVTPTINKRGCVCNIPDRVAVLCNSNRDKQTLEPCNHEEADTRIMAHVGIAAAAQGHTKIMVCTVNNDIVGKNHQFLLCHAIASLGLSFELAQWIAGNLSHVVGVATDSPTLESHETREFTTRTIANVLGRAGVYMIESVRAHNKIPDHGCMTLAMPLKMLHSVYVPTRLVAFCPTKKTEQKVVVGLRRNDITEYVSRDHDIHLDDLMTNTG